MLWIADRPAAHARAKLHKVDRDRLGERRRTIPTCPVDNDLKGGLPPIVEPAIACGSLKRAGDFGQLGTMSVKRVESQGCPHCAGREIVGWGRSHGLMRFRCKSCGRTFNALTRTPMAHLRKKERWLDHARAMIEGRSLAKTAEPCGVHPTTAFRWRHRFLRAPADDKPRSLSGIVEADETFILESFKGRWSDLPRKARKRGGKARYPGSYQDNIPVLVARDRKGATFDAVLLQADNASIAAVLTGVVTPGNHLVGDGGKPLAAFARKARIPFHAVPSPGKPTAEAPHLGCAGRGEPTQPSRAQRSCSAPATSSV
jgi:transposase-like protein